MDSSDYLNIIPLGALYPPIHSFPVDHIYYHYRDNQLPFKAYDRPVYVPGDMTVFEITENKLTRQDGSYWGSSYGLRFIICDNLEYRLGPITKLSPAFTFIKENNKPICEKNAGTPGGYNSLNLTNETCTYTINQKFKAGDLMGYVGTETESQETQIDVWLMHQDKHWADLCPLTPYNGNLKTQIYNKLGDYIDGKFFARTKEPRCGDNNQDIMGTIKGRWYHKSADKEEPLAFVNEYLFTDFQTISFSSDFTQPGKISFIPTHQGLINRDFSEVKADNLIYCYQPDKTKSEIESTKDQPASGFKFDFAINGKVLVRLVDDNNIQIEQQEGNCYTYETFKTPLTFQR